MSSSDIPQGFTYKTNERQVHIMSTATMNLTKEQEHAILYFVQTFATNSTKKDSITERMHGDCSKEDFDQDEYSKMERLIDNLMLGNDSAKNYYRMAAHIITDRHSDSDPMFNEICAIEALYQMGIEEGKRIERKKKTSKGCNQ